MAVRDAQSYLRTLPVAHVSTGGRRRDRTVNTTVNAVAYLCLQDDSRGLALCPSHLLAILHGLWIAHLPADHSSSTCSETQIPVSDIRRSADWCCTHRITV